MTTPGGVPNLPAGALTIDNIASTTQDMTGDAMKSRAVDRFPSIFNNSTGLDPALDITPFGILTRIWAEVNSLIANADPADIQGPEDLPELVLEFIEGLPVIGELVGLLEAILGEYDGDDETLLTIQAIFAPIRAMVDALSLLDLSSPEAFISSLINVITTGGSGLAMLEQIGTLIGLPDLGDLLPKLAGGMGGIASLLGLLGIDDLNGDLDTDAIWSNVITNKLNPLGLLEAILPEAIRNNLEAILGDIDLDDDGLDVEDVWHAIVTNFLNPAGLLNFSDLADTIFEAITGRGRDDPAGDPLTDLQNALRGIPFLNILGVGGPSNIGGSITGGWDQLISGFVGVLGSGAGLADLFNIGQQVSSRATLGQFSFDILGIRNNKSMTSGFLPTSQSNISLDKIVMTPGTVAITQSTALTSYKRIEEAIDVGVVSWQGSGVTSVTDCYVNVYKMNETTGDNGGALHGSVNIIANLSGSMQQNIYSLPTPVHFEPGDIAGFEIAIRGAGTHTVLGAVSTLVDQSVYPRRWSSVRNSGTSAPPSTAWTPTYSNNVPFIEFGVSASLVAIPHSPEIRQFSTAGTTTYPIPSWANFVDRLVLGGAGGGHQGGTWGIGGEGGDNATWISDTLARGTDFSGSPSLTTVIGAGGTGGTGNGGNGGNSVSSISGGHTLTSTGGVGANSFDIAGSEHAGESPGTGVFSGTGPTWQVAGGAQQNTYGAAGNAPGGGGAGGNWISFQPGGAGAPGTILYRFRQS